MRYISAELHNHTLHSDGSLTLAELFEISKAEGLDIIALTDHNTDSGLEELTKELSAKTVPFIAGVEWTTFFGHFLALNCGADDDCLKATPDDIDVYFKQIKQKGGLIGLAHPFDLGSPMCTGGAWEFNIKDMSLVDYIEVWHDAFPTVAVETERSKKLWLSLLDRGFKIAPIYGRDRHSASGENKPYARTLLGIEGDVTAEAALKAIRKGRVVLTMAHDFEVYAEKDGINYNIGDTMPSGEYTLHFVSKKGNCRAQWKKYGVTPQKIKVYNNGKTIFELPFEKECAATVRLEKGYCYVEAEGVINNVYCTLAMTAAFYIG